MPMPDPLEPTAPVNHVLPPPPPPPPSPPPSPPPLSSANRVTPPLRPGQLSPGWRMAFIAGWIGVLAGFGALWQAGRIAGIAPWWLGPETDPRFLLVIALPFLAPLLTVVTGVMNLRGCCYVGIAAGLLTMAVSLGDLHFPGLALVDAIIGSSGIVISIACLGGRMRAAD